MAKNPVTLQTCLAAADIVALVRSGASSATAQVAAAKSRIDVNEQQITAWQHLDWQRADSQAKLIDQKNQHGALAGVPVGVKDIIDT
ncbi:MAG: hypothetical protein HN838_13375, partial [Rhodospirillaceae bacterium]|nr:hypothetical protein [Rhodospirillaceae bacterium]